MAKAGAGEASALSSDGLSEAMALRAIAFCFESKVFARGGGLNAKNCPYGQYCSAYCFNRRGGDMSRSNAALAIKIVRSQLEFLQFTPDSLVSANRVEALAADAASITYGELGLWGAS